MSHPNEDLINKFYNSFSQKNSGGMIECYSDSIEFQDPVFGVLTGSKPKAMWQMLIEKSSGLQISFSNVVADDNSGKADWEAVYDFSKTNRKIINRIHAEFTFKDGKITSHRDTFSLWKWAGMAMGLKGYLIGFTPIVQNKIKSEAISGLELYMKRKRIT
jgi:ketosteroid isomerase-like protein